MNRYRMLAAAAALACAALSSATGLAVGDMAPPIKAYKWVQGDPVTNGAGGLRVVEFWATWCGPCKESIPHLTELAKKFKGKVTFTGVDVYERSPDDVATVKAFVKEMGDKMGYKIAVDDKTGTMGRTWMEAAGQNGIPTAFVVDQKGQIAWIGHPMEGLEQALDQLVAGKYDIAKAKAEFTQAQQKEQYAETARQDISLKIMAAETAYKAGKKADALAILNKTESAHPEYKNQLEMGKFMVILEDDKPGATAIVEQEAASAGPQAPYAYLQFALIAGGTPKASKDDLAYSVTLADKALAKYASDPIVDFEASTIYFRTGNLDKANSLAQDALKNLSNAKPEDQPPLKSAIDRRIAELQAKAAATKKPAQ